MKPGFKYAVIHRHRMKYPIVQMCRMLKVSRSGYYKYVKQMQHPAKDLELAEKIRAKQESSRRTYGYRRIKLWLDSEGIVKNPKTILRIMHKYDLLSEIRRRRKWVQMGWQVHKYQNLLNREFNATHPNQKWVTDISYIHTKEGVLYLSMIRDLYDRSIIAYKTGTSQTVNLVLDTIHLAMKSVKTEVAGSCSSTATRDLVFQYTSQAYFDLTKEYGITPSMSRRGNCYDNALAENFFGILKTECIYRHKPETFEQANKMIDDYIYFYNHERIQLKQDWLRLRFASPVKLPTTRGSFYSCLLILGQFTFGKTVCSSLCSPIWFQLILSRSALRSCAVCGSPRSFAIISASVLDAPVSFLLME